MAIATRFKIDGSNKSERARDKRLEEEALVFLVVPMRLGRWEGRGVKPEGIEEEDIVK